MERKLAAILCADVFGYSRLMGEDEEKLRAFGEPEVSEDDHSLAEEQARARLREIAARHLEGVNYQIHTASAPERSLARAVVRVANEVEADLIVLKTHGRKGLSHLILGSVAEEIVRTAPCPVLTLTPGAQEKTSHLRLQEHESVS